MDQPKWLEAAWAELGQREVAGRAANPRIRAYFRDAKRPETLSDEVPWCAAFLGACLERAGIAGTGSLMARSYLGWGEPIEKAKLGAVAVLSRGSDPALGHTGFLIGGTDANVVLLGGNQNDAVTVHAFPRSRLLGFRWPALAGPGSSPRLPPSEEDPADSGFDTALAHVLEMEGGWSDDRHDPGGPTNKGITLAVFAVWRRATLDERTLGALRQQLRAIGDDEVRAIYRARYWEPSRAALLPAGLALMHFDASVNHGVGGAARMLQKAVDVTVDGEIGPETRAAITAAPAGRTVAAYAEIRRRRYRALPHFWRFGRGWLRRVDRTVAAAEALASPPAKEFQHRKGNPEMTNAVEKSVAGKWWPESMTVWGTIITALATVLPAVGPLIGLDITGELVRQAGHIVHAIQAVSGLVGIALTIYGRVRASEPLARREINVRV